MIKKDNLLIKKFEKTSLNYGKKPEDRTINELLDSGIILLDKDSGPTCQLEIDFLKKILKIQKAGHSGTLDPKVTGLLLTGLGKATRLMEYMLLSDKEYICLLYLHKEVSDEKLNEAIKKFTGTIKQTPPIISAVVRRERERTIYSIDILEKKENNKYILFKVKCERGTYIRKLCSDIGDYLGVKGQMMELRRTKTGPFYEKDDNLISLDKLRNLYELYIEREDEIKNFNTKKLNIGIDIDDTLTFVWGKEVIEEYKKNHDPNFEFDSLKTHGFNEINELKNIFFKFHRENILKFKPNYFSKETLEFLKKTGHNLYIVTSRPNTDEEKTLIWLEKNFGKNFFKEIIFMHNEEDSCKSLACKKYALDLIIEDAPHHIENISKNEKTKIFIFDNPWNKELNENSNKIRVHSWTEVLDKIKTEFFNPFEKELKKYILPMENALIKFKKVYVRDSAIDSICNGSDLAIPGISMLEKEINLGEEIAIMSLKGELIAIGTAFLNSEDVIKKKKGIFVKTNKVLMEIGTYPKFWKFEN